MNNKILVTGGAGFIGSHLVAALLENNFNVVVADTLLRGNKIPSEIMPYIEFYKTDVRDKEAMIKISKGCSRIFHFAALLGVDIVADNPVDTMDTEVKGMQNITESAIHNGVEKIIYASTSGIYGHSAIERSVTENIMLDPRTSYAMAKRYNEIYLASFFEEKKLNSVSLRFFNVYGPRQDNRMVIPRFIEQAISNQPITIYGDGRQTRDFTYIDDTIKACLLLADKIDGCEIFNIANENEISIKTLAEKIIKVSGSKSKMHYIEAPAKRYDFEVERRFGNSDKLFKATGYKPDTDIFNGIQNTYKSIIKKTA